MAKTFTKIEKKTGINVTYIVRKQGQDLGVKLSGSKTFQNNKSLLQWNRSEHPSTVQHISKSNACANACEFHFLVKVANDFLYILEPKPGEVIVQQKQTEIPTAAENNILPKESINNVTSSVQNLLLDSARCSFVEPEGGEIMDAGFEIVTPRPEKAKPVLVEHWEGIYCEIKEH